MPHAFKMANGRSMYLLELTRGSVHFFPSKSMIIQDLPVRSSKLAYFDLDIWVVGILDLLTL